METTKEWGELISLINERFIVDFETGFIHNKRTNKVMAGTDSYGYIQCHIGNYNGKRKMMKGHQIVYLLYHEELPVETIDHYDRIKINNPISNLRPATHTEQSINSGSDGVVYRKDQKVWRARIRLGKGSKQLEKTFTSHAAALSWRKEKEKLWN